nr:carboxylesterase nlhh [Quercus suber]
MAPPSYSPPGRLGNPDMSLATDPRTNKKLLQVVSQFGADQNAPPPKDFSVKTSISDLSKVMAAINNQTEALYKMMPNDLPEDDQEPEVSREDRVLNGPDGNTIKIHVFRTIGASGKLPCVVYLHGGAMVFLNTMNKVHERWCKSMAVAGVVAIAVDFRNAWTAEGHNPFPAGLNDCATAVQYIAAHKEELGIDKIVLQGESGGANLSIATTLKAKREGWLKFINGVYGGVPYISGAYGWPEERILHELPSLVENNGYFLERNATGVMAHYYTPNQADKTNPLAWPYFATQEDLTGLPPHILAMDELDMLRDEGMAFYRKLFAAGVTVAAHMNLGITHGASLIFRQALPEVHNHAIRDITSFAKSL